MGALSGDEAMTVLSGSMAGAPAAAGATPRAGGEARIGHAVAAGVSAIDPRMPTSGRIDPVTQASAAWQGRAELKRGGPPDPRTPAGPPPSFKWTLLEQHLTLIVDPAPEAATEAKDEAAPLMEDGPAAGRIETDVTTLRSLEAPPAAEMDVRR